MPHRVGQDVVYVGPDYREHPLVRVQALNVPLPQHFYVIRKIIVAPTGWGYLLHGMVNKVVYIPAILREEEMCWVDHHYLKPVSKPDITDLRELLKPENLKELIR